MLHGVCGHVVAMKPCVYGSECNLFCCFVTTYSLCGPLLRLRHLFLSTPFIVLGLSKSLRNICVQFKEFDFLLTRCAQQLVGN